MNKSRSAQRRLAKADLVLLAVLLLFGVLAFFAVRMLTQKNGTDVQVLLHGEIYGTYPLSEEQKIPIHQNGTVTNTLQIADGTVKMIQADCPDCMPAKPGRCSDPWNKRTRTGFDIALKKKGKADYEANGTA